MIVQVNLKFRSRKLLNGHVSVLDVGGKDCGDEFSASRGCRDDGSARAVLFVAFGEDIETHNAGLGNDMIGSYGGRSSDD